MVPWRLTTTETKFIYNCGSGPFNWKLADYWTTIRDLNYLETGLRIKCQLRMRRPLKLWEITGLKKKNIFLEHLISQEQMLVSLTGVDNKSLVWETEGCDQALWFLKVSEIIVAFCWEISLTLSCRDLIDMKSYHNSQRRQLGRPLLKNWD